MPDESQEKNTTEKTRHCGCKCQAECDCACTCPHQCICAGEAAECMGTCRIRNPAKTDKEFRNLVVSIDGTSNQFGTNNTNVVELHSRIIKESKDRRPQLTFYSSGIGTYVPPSLLSLAYLKQSIGNKIDLAIAWNFKKQVQHAYRWLADEYKPGDVIYLFGFSRGAYQVRTLAGMITTVGLVYRGNQRLIPFAYELYAKRHKGKAIKDHEKADELCRHFKKTFSRPDVRVHFVGAWDTVSSVGVLRGQPLPLTTSADHICHFRHALALDERRVRFLPEYVHSAIPKAIAVRDEKNLKSGPGPSQPSSQKQNAVLPEESNVKDTARDRYIGAASGAVGKAPPFKNEPKGTIKEVWFAGTHSDIGGGNRENISLDLAGVPLLWMENEATSAGLHLQPRNEVWKWEAIKQDEPIESLKGPFWWFMEKIRLSRSTYNVDKLEETKSWPPHHGQGRLIVEKQLVHASVAFKANTYRPRATFSDSEVGSWETLVGKGTVDDIDWAWDWRGRLEMDIFDPSLAGDTGKNFVDAVSKETWQHLKLIPFLALSDNAVSSLLKAGVFDKLIGILEGSDESGVQAHWQAASSTSLYLMIKSGRTNPAQDAKATSIVHDRLEDLLQTQNPKDRLAHLTLLTALGPLAPSTTWKIAQDTILGLVLNAQPNESSSIEKPLANKRRFWQVGPKRTALVGGTDAPRDDPGDFDAVARCLANLTSIEGFCHIFDKKYGDAIPKLLRFSARAALETIDGLCTNREFDGIIQDNMPKIMDFIKHDDRDVRSAAATTFGNLAKYSVFQESMIASVPMIIELFKATDAETRAASIGAVGELAEQAAFQESMKKFVPQIVELMKDDTYSVSSTAGTVVGNLAKHVVFQDPLKRSLSRVVEFFRDHGIHAQWSSTDAFRKIAEEAAFRESIKRLFPSIVQLLQDEDSFVRWNAETVIRRLASQSEFRDTVKQLLLGVSNSFKDTKWQVRMAGVLIIEAIGQEAVFEESVKEMLPRIIELLKDKNEMVRSTSAGAITGLISNSAFRKSIVTSVPQIAELLKDTSWQVRRNGLYSIIALANEDVFLPLILNIVPRVVDLLQDEDDPVRSAAAEAVGNLAKHAEFQKYIEASVPQVVVLLKDTSWEVRASGIGSIVALAEEDVFLHLLKEAVPRVLELITDGDEDVQSAAAKAVGNLAKHTIFHHSIGTSVPVIFSLLKNTNPRIRVASIDSIINLSEHDSFLDSTLNIGLHIMSLLQDENEMVRQLASWAVGSFARHTTFHSSIQASLPYIANLLKDNDPGVRRCSIETVIKLAEEDVFHDLLTNIAAKIMEMLNDPDHEVRSVATYAVGDLARHSVFHRSIKPVTPRIAELLKDSEWKVKLAAIGTTIELAEQDLFHDSLARVFPQMAQLINGDIEVTVAVVCDLITKSTLNDSIDTCVPPLTELLRHQLNSWQMQLIGLRTVIKLAEQDVFRHSMRNLVPHVLEFLKDEDQDVRAPAADAVGNLAKHTEFHNLLAASVPVIAKLLKDSRRDVRLASIRTIGKLAEQDTFRDSTVNIVPQVLELFKDDCYNVRSAVAAFVRDLSKYSVFHDLLEAAVPQMAQLLKDGWYEVRSSSIHAISELSTQDSFHDIIEHILPQITEFRDALRDTDIEDHKNACNAAETIVEAFKTSETAGDETTEVQPFASENSEIPLQEANGNATEPEQLVV